MNFDVLLTRPSRISYQVADQATSQDEHAQGSLATPKETDTPSSTATNATKSSRQRKRSESGSRQMGAGSKIMNVFTQFYSRDIDQVESSEESRPFEHGEALKVAEEVGSDMKGRMESKIMSMWHNVKYGWNGKIRSSFSREQPVWLLGNCYHSKFSPPPSMESSMEMSTLSCLSAPHDEGPVEEVIIQELGTDIIETSSPESAWEEGIEGFKRDFISRLWMTYRREFPTMNGSTYTSDCGWGCMLRSGQMLLGQTLICHFLGRHWRWDPDTQIHNTTDDFIHKKIIRWFGDSSSRISPFSIHSMVHLGEDLGKKPGDWYGPVSVSHIIRQAVKRAGEENGDFDNLNVYVAQDCTVYIQDLLEECLVDVVSNENIAPWQQHINLSDNSKTKLWKSVLILVPLRLGTEKLNLCYGNCLKALLSTEYCVGIIGGRPKHSLYFIGFQEDKLIHLDPHYCQDMVDVTQENFPVQSFHCKSPRKMKLAKMDPCCCIGFYCKTEDDFNKFVESVQPYLLPVKNQSPNGAYEAELEYPLFVFSRSSHKDHQKSGISLATNPIEEIRVLESLHLDESYEDTDTEEFVIL